MDRERRSSWGIDPGEDYIIIAVECIVSRTVGKIVVVAVLMEFYYNSDAARTGVRSCYSISNCPYTQRRMTTARYKMRNKRSLLLLWVSSLALQLKLTQASGNNVTGKLRPPVTDNPLLGKQSGILYNMWL